MKILSISHIFPPAIDGGSKVIYQLSHHLETQGHQLIYLSSNCSSTDDFVKPKYTKSKIIKNNQIKISVHHYLIRPLKFLNLFIPKNSYLYQFLQIFQKGPIYKLFPFLKATFKILKFKPDLIIAGPLPNSTVLYARFFKKLTSAKLLINSSFHQSDPDFHRLPLIKTLQFADFLWTLTEYEGKYLINKFNINSSKIILAGNGVDPDFLIKTPNKQKNNQSKYQNIGILFIGSLSAHKRVDLLIKSFSSLITNHQIDQSSNLTIVGQKTLFSQKIEEIYQSLPKSIQKQIYFKFNINNKELINIIDNCQFLVLPSVQESFGLVLIESWIRSKAVITSDIPPLKEIVTKTNGGLIFKTDNQSDLEQKIKTLLSQPKLCYQLGQNGHTYVKNNYTWSKVSQKICQKIQSSH